MKILIVEDDPNLTELWCDLLAAQGHAVRALDDPQAARRRLMTEAFDLLLIDLTAGAGMDGVMALATYCNPDCRVVAAVGAAGKAVVGDVAVLRKPVDIEHLVAICAHLDLAAPLRKAAG